MYNSPNMEAIKEIPKLYCSAYITLFASDDVKQHIIKMDSWDDKKALEFYKTFETMFNMNQFYLPKYFQTEETCKHVGLMIYVMATNIYQVQKNLMIRYGC